MQIRTLSGFILFIILSLISGADGYGQTFSTTTSALIINRGGLNKRPEKLANSITVSGITNNLDGINLGLTEVRINVQANQYPNLEIFLVSPSGRMILLVDGQGTLTDITGTFVFQLDPSLWLIRYWDTNTPIHAGYRPDVTLNAMNNDQSPNGMGTCTPGNGYPVTSEWFKFTARCSTDVIRIRTTGAPKSAIVTGNCGGPYTQVRCYPSHTAGGTYNYTFGTGDFPSLNPGQTYYLIMEGQNGITDAYDIYWIPGDCGTLPVGFISFKGHHNSNTSSIDLTWQTSFERDNYGFHIQYRLVPGGNLISSGFVPSSNSSEGSKYNFSIPAKEEGIYEVILTQEDIDGKQTEYGPVVVSVVPEIKDPVVIKYNNETPEAWVRLPKDGEFRYSLYTTTGATISSDLVKAKKGWNIISLPFDLSSGVYFIKILTEDFYSSKKLIKE